VLFFFLKKDNSKNNEEDSGVVKIFSSVTLSGIFKENNLELKKRKV
jgi:hypothetical protein